MHIFTIKMQENGTFFILLYLRQLEKLGLTYQNYGKSAREITVKFSNWKLSLGWYNGCMRHFC